MIDIDGRLGPLDGGRVAPRRQTLVAGFVILARQTEAQLLQGVQLMPFASVWREVFRKQCWRELELVQILMRATRWQPDPARVGQVIGWQRFWSGQVLAVTTQMLTEGPERAGLATIALGHALHSVVRLNPLLPPDAAPDDPFVAALLQVDAAAARLAEEQIRFLEQRPFGLERSEIEAALADKHEAVSGLWREFVERL
jgi:hypothetical protein